MCVWGGLPWWLSGKESAWNAGDARDSGLFPGWQDPLEEGVLLILFMTPVVSLFTLFTEPTVGKVQAKRLEGDVRSRRNCRHIYSPLAGMAAITQPLSCLVQQP